MAKMAKALEPEVIGTTSIECFVPLTDQEMIDMGAELAAANEAYNAHELQKKYYASQAQSAKAKADRLSSIVYHRQEMRTVECDIMAVWESDTAHVVRTDTGEEHLVRLLRADPLREGRCADQTDDPFGAWFEPDSLRQKALYFRAQTLPPGAGTVKWGRGSKRAVRT